MRAKQFCVLTTRASKNACKSPVTSVAVRSKAVVLLLLSHCLLLFQLFVEVLCLGRVLLCSA